MASHQQCGEELSIDDALHDDDVVVVARPRFSWHHGSVACSLSHERNGLASDLRLHQLLASSPWLLQSSFSLRFIQGDTDHPLCSPSFCPH